MNHDRPPPRRAGDATAAGLHRRAGLRPAGPPSKAGGEQPPGTRNPNLAGVGEECVDGEEKISSEESLQITRVRFSFPH